MVDCRLFFVSTATYHGDPGGDVDRVHVVAVDEGVEPADGGRGVQGVHLGR